MTTRCALVTVGAALIAAAALSFPSFRNAVRSAARSGGIAPNRSFSVDDCESGSPLPPCPTTSGRAINFYRDPGEFVDTFAACIRDKSCRVFYHHVGKTGGTTIEARLFGLFPPGFEHGTKSCCSDSAIDRFEARKDDYCGAKFTSYQVVGEKFRNIVMECMNTTLGEKPQSAIALTSFREPIQRTLSSIHQTCNKAFSKRSDAYQAACKRCSYEVEEDKNVWDKLIERTNTFFKGIALVSSMDIKGVQVMTIDTVDIDAFFSKLHSALLPHWNVSLSGIENSEALSRCSFGMTSSIFRALAPSEAIYRNLTIGI